LLDAHCDSLYIRTLFGEEADLAVTGEKYPCRVTLSRLREGNVGCVFMNCGDIDLLLSSTILDNLHKLAGRHAESVSICYSAGDVSKAVSSGKLAVVISLEGQMLFLEQLDLLRNWHRLGARVASISHGEGAAGLTDFARRALQGNRRYRLIDETANPLQVTPSTDGYMTPAEREGLYRREKGLTEYGKLALREMARLGMVCDLSHSNDATFWEALETTSGKLCATHSNCAALCCHSRNLTDGMMKALARHGGVMGVCFYGEFIDRENPTLRRYVEHILHALEVMGPDHVGIGSDYDGVPPDCFMAVPDPGQTGGLWAELRKAGADTATMQKIAHGNFLRLLG
jgi:microsomal dipeptidase-like Zn-dependent dipeptidase